MLRTQKVDEGTLRVTWTVPAQETVEDVNPKLLLIRREQLVAERDGIDRQLATIDELLAEYEKAGVTDSDRGR